MTQGYSGSYAVNGVNIPKPSTGKWEQKEMIARNGYGIPTYPSVTDFTLTWGILSTSELNQLLSFHLYVQNTGTVVTDLPKWGDAGYLFYSYSGTVVNRPSVGAYFVEYVEDVQLVISNIRVS